MIYHITENASWKEAVREGSYSHPSLRAEGFIHACSSAQIASVRKRYFEGVTDLLLLHIDEALVSSEIKYEMAPSVNEIFPHIYGPLNIGAVIKTESL